MTISSSNLKARQLAAQVQTLETKSEESPWKGVCSSRCYTAKTDKKRCKCRCKGEHHAKGQQRKRESKAIDEFFER